MTGIAAKKTVLTVVKRFVRPALLTGSVFLSHSEHDLKKVFLHET